MPRGVTLLELLIVLVIMAMSAALVAPVIGRGDVEPQSTSAPWITSARHTAIRRAEPLRLELTTGGDWRLTSQRTGLPIDSGRSDLQHEAAVLLIDAMGGCVPAERTPVVFDALSCTASGDPGFSSNPTAGRANPAVLPGGSSR